MFTDRRLNQAYKNARVEYFDSRSKYVLFSDCHRGDDSISDEFTRNQPIFYHALNYYYENGYTYVELGDGDELWEYPHFKIIRSAHTDVFSIMKKFFDDKRMIMLWGNHNIYLKNKNYVKNHYYQYPDDYNPNMHPLFPGLKTYESLIFRNKDTMQEIFAVHGHQGDFLNDQIWGFSMIWLRYFWRFLHVVGFHNPSSPAGNLYKRHKIEIAYKKWIQKNKMMLVCGHTHRPRFPHKKELPYFNTGCCLRTKGITCIEIVDNKIMMVDWRIRSDPEGNLKVVRLVARGPEAIEKYRKD